MSERALALALELDFGTSRKPSGLGTGRLESWLRLSLFGALAILSSPSCVQDDGARWTPFKRFHLMSLDDERLLGMDFDRELHEHFKLISDPVVTEFLQDLGLQIVEGVDPKTFIYRFRVVEAPQLNAFAVPGGYIYFHTGTLMAVGSVDELAVVMAHEIAHVSKRHLAHRRQDRQIPTLLTNMALIAATVATKDAAPMITGMAINVAVDLHYSRTDEAESDRVGAVYASRAGFDPSRGAHFFERILAERHLYADGIPPYLFSHPAVEERIAEFRARDETLRPVGKPKPGTRERFRAMQVRLARLLDHHRTALPGLGVAEDHRSNDTALREIEGLARTDQNDRALQALTLLAIEDPLDPRIPFHIAEVLAAEGRITGAIAAYQRTLELDSSRALVYFRLGEAYRVHGDRERAVYAFERALQLSKPSSPLAERAHWETVKLTFGVIPDSGFATPMSRFLSGSPAGRRVETYPSDATQMAWWGRVSGPLLTVREALRVRWRDPAGRIVREESLEEVGRVHVRSQIDLEAEKLPSGSNLGPRTRSARTWTVEVLLDGEVVHRDEVILGSGESD